jgi:hypothetical protein
MTEEVWRTQWLDALDRLEVDVERAEQMLRAHDPAPMPEWQPPVVHISLPEDLVPRARLILERQLAVANDITRAITTNQQQRALTSKISANIPADIPVYLDITA